MSVTAQSIIDRARLQLIDADGTRWTDAELLKWITDAERTLVAVSPGVSSTVAVISAVAGTRQTIPSDGHMLLGITRNMAANGTDPGRAIRTVSREILDAQDPDWHTSTSSAVVQNYIYDPQEPTKFYVYPPNNATGKIEVVYSVMPPSLTSGADTLVIQDIYQTAVFDYVMFRAHQKDSDFAAGMAVAQSYWQSFAAYVTQGENAALSNSPNLVLASPNVTVKGGAK